MPIQICGVSEVPGLSHIPFSHIISIRDSRQNLPDIRGFKGEFTFHSFLFDDKSSADASGSVTAAQIERLLQIYSKTDWNDSILIHCFAGVSRSTAAAFIWFVSKGVSFATAYEAVVQLRGPFVCPNQLMVQLADDNMGLGGAMIMFLQAELGRRSEERATWFREHS